MLCSDEGLTDECPLFLYLQCATVLLILKEPFLNTFEYIHAAKVVLSSGTLLAASTSAISERPRDIQA